MNIVHPKWLLFIIAVIGVGAVVIGIFYTLGYAESFQGVQGSIKVTRTSTGGLSGNGDGRNITISGNQMTIDGKKRPLSAKELIDLRRHIEQADFFNLPPTYIKTRCPDAFSTTITVTRGAKTHTVTFSHCGNRSAPPNNLVRLSKYLVDLAG